MMLDSAEKSKETKLFSKLLSKISERKKSGISDKKIPKQKIEGYNSETSDDSEGSPNEKETPIVKVDLESENNENMEVDEDSDGSDSSSDESSDTDDENASCSKETKLLNALKSKVESNKKEKQLKRVSSAKQSSKGVIEVEDDQMDVSESAQAPIEEAPVESKLTKTKDIQAVLQDSDFQILGKQVFEQRRKIRSVLPAWLAYPRVISNDLSDTTTEVKDLSYLDEKVKENLLASGVHHLFPVQKEVIPFILNIQTKPSPFWPRDICCSAPTGSGKTLAFAVPIVQLLMQRVQKKVRALVILPVNELAEQVYQVFKQVSWGKMSLLEKFWKVKFDLIFSCAKGRKLSQRSFRAQCR